MQVPLGDVVKMGEDEEGHIIEDALLWKLIEQGDLDVDELCLCPLNDVVHMPILTCAIVCGKEATAVKLLELGASPHVSSESEVSNAFFTPAYAAIDRGRLDVLRVLMDMGLSLESECSSQMVWNNGDDDDSDDEGWQEESMNMLQCALSHGSLNTLKFMLAYKYVPTEFLHDHRKGMWKWDSYAVAIKDAIDVNRTLEAAWCTTWLTYNVIRGPWRHLCPMIVESMLNVAAKEHEDDEKETVSKKIKN